MNNRAIQDKLYSYIKDTFVREDDFLKEIRNSCDSAHREMQLSSVEGQMLKVFMNIAGVTRVLEIGTCVGYSTVWMSKSLPPEGIIITIEQNEVYTTIAEKNFKDCPNIKLIKGDALEKIQELSCYGLFDMIFIDAQKSHYLDYLLRVEKFLKKGALVVADNTLLFNQIYDESFAGKKSWQGMQAFNKYLADNDSYSAILLPTAEGMTVATKIK